MLLVSGEVVIEHWTLETLLVNYFEMDHMDMNVTNATNSTKEPTSILPYHYWMLYITLTLQLVLFVFGSLSNTLFCVIFIRYPRLQTPFNMLAFALCANDLLASVATPFGSAATILQHITKSLETTLCRYYSCFFMNLCKWFAVLVMVEMAVIRARCVLATRRYMVKKRTICVLIVLNYFASGAFSTYRCFLSNNSVCDQNNNEDTSSRLLNISVFLALFIILALGYAILMVVTHRRATNIRSNNRYEIATLRACAIIVLTYLGLHLPYITQTILLHIGINEDRSYYTHNFLVCIFMMSHLADSFILLITSTQYRKHIKLLLRRKILSPYPVKTWAFWSKLWDKAKKERNKGEKSSVLQARSTAFFPYAVFGPKFEWKLWVKQARKNRNF